MAETPSGNRSRSDEVSAAAEELARENRELREKYDLSIQYIRSKINQLLKVMGTATLRPEELDDKTLISLDPIGIISNSFTQILQHLHETNRNLELARDEIQAIFDSAGMGILVIDRDFHVLAFNRVIKEYFFSGTDIDESVLCHRAICGLDFSVHACPFISIFESGRIVRQSRWLLKDRYFDVVGSPIGNVDGVIEQIVIGYMDITDRVLAEESLRQSEEKYRDLFENANDLIQSVGPDGSFQYVNRAWMETLGYGPEDLPDLTIFDIIHPGCSDCSADFKSVVFGEKTGRVETRFITKDRKEIIVEGNISTVIRDGKLAGTRGMFRDITMRKHAEEVLASERERLAVTLRSIGDGVITTDINSRITLMNRVAENLTGWRQDNALGSLLTTVFHIADEKTGKDCEDSVAIALREKKVIELGSPVVLAAKDGSRRTISNSVAPIFDSRSEIIGVVIVFRDVTERHRIEERLRNVQKIESLGVLAGGIAHDFNNLLNAIMGNIDLAMLSLPPESKNYQYMEQAAKAAIRSRDLTTQLLTFSRGGAPIRKAASITELIRDSSDFALRGSKCRAEFSIQDGIWKADIDEGQISQVINNLVLNAAQAMSEGGLIRIAADNVLSRTLHAGLLTNRRYVRITIADQGKGIPREDIPRIFEPYFTTKEKGSGLGLATSYSIVHRHEGAIEVESEENRGTTVRVYLPAADVEAEEVSVSRDKASQPALHGRVLIMDDEEMILLSTSAMLQNMGYAVETATEGKEALGKYEKALREGRRFDAVIIDLTIPGAMGGQETMKRLLEIDPLAKGIVSSGYSSDAVMAHYRQHGFSGVLAKPYRNRDLAEVLHLIFSRQ